MATVPIMLLDLHNSSTQGPVSTSSWSAVSSTFDPLGAGLSSLAYQTMVLSGTLANQLESRKRSVWLSGWNPKAKSPESDNHGVLLSVAMREFPMVTLPLFWANRENW